MGVLELFFRDLGSKGKILLGSRENYFQGFWEIISLFPGIKRAQDHFIISRDQGSTDSTLGASLLIVFILVLQSSRWERGIWLLCLSAWCLVVVVWLFHAMPRVCLQSVIVVFPDHYFTYYFPVTSVSSDLRNVM